MHDPSTLLFDIPWVRLDIWHDEPSGCDAGTVCADLPNDSVLEVICAVKHWPHLRFRWRPYLKVKRWLTERCAECDRRFFWKDSRTGYMGSDEVFHSTCMSLRQVRNDLRDLTDLVSGEGDYNSNWRARYRLDNLHQKGAGRDSPEDQG